MKVFSETNVGRKRENNEDYMLTYDLSENFGLFMVLDGIGGANSGEVASSLAANKTVEYMKEHFKEDRGNLDSLNLAVKYANRCVYEKSKSSKVYKDMGTTISLIYKENEEGYIVNIGDSRIYEVIEGKLCQLTEDDTYVNALVRDKIISREDAKTHPERHVLIKAVGVTRTIEVNLKELGNIKGRRFLLCSDGLTNMVQEEKIAEIILKNETNKNEICKELINAANANGGTDNITVMYIEF